MHVDISEFSVRLCRANSAKPIVALEQEFAEVSNTQNLLVESLNQVLTFVDTSRRANYYRAVSTPKFNGTRPRKSELRYLLHGFRIGPPADPIPLFPPGRFVYR